MTSATRTPALCCCYRRSRARPWTAALPTPRGRGQRRLGGRRSAADHRLPATFCLRPDAPRWGLPERQRQSDRRPPLCKPEPSVTNHAYCERREPGSSRTGTRAAGVGKSGGPQGRSGYGAVKAPSAVSAPACGGVLCSSKNCPHVPHSQYLIDKYLLTTCGDSANLWQPHAARRGSDYTWCKAGGIAHFSGSDCTWRKRAAPPLSLTHKEFQQVGVITHG